MMATREPTLFELLGKVDWPRAIHRGAAFVRAVRGDGAHAQADEAREHARASALRKMINDIARKAVGCVAPASCDCPICTEAAQP